MLSVCLLFNSYFSEIQNYAGLQYEKASRAGVIRTSNVICGIFWQSISTGISPDGLTLTGVILVVIGSLLIVMEKNSSDSDMVYATCRHYLCGCGCCSACTCLSGCCLEKKGKEEQEMYEELSMLEEHSNSSSFSGGGGGLMLMTEQLSSSAAASMKSREDLELVDKVGVRSRGNGSF